MLARTAAWLNESPFPWRFAVVAVACASPSLWCGLSIDDFAHIAVLRGLPTFTDPSGPSLDIFDFADGDPERMRHVMDLGIWPWWTLPELKTAFWRPVTALTHYLDDTLWPNTPFLMHLQNLCWFGGVVILATLCYRRFLPGLPAAAAALLYAISDIHAIPAGWVANRNAEIALLFGLLTLLLHDAGRRGSSPASWLAPATLVLGLLSNEGALGITAYLFAYACFLDRAPWRGRLASLAPYAVVVCAWRLLYSTLGYGAWGSPAYIDPLADPQTFFSEALARMPVMLASLWLLPPAELYFVYPPRFRTLVVVWCVLVVAGLLVCMWPLFRAKEHRFLAVGMFVSLLPACATSPSDRLLGFAGLGGLGLVAAFLYGAGANLVARDRGGRRMALRMVAWVLLVMHGILAPLASLVGVPLFHWLLDDVEQTVYATDLDSSIAEKTVVFMNSPGMFHTAYFPVLRSLAGLPIPGRIRSIAPNVIGRTPLYVYRSDAFTLEVAPEHGYPFVLLRDAGHPFEVGDTVALTGVTVRILEMNARGFPARVGFEFDVPLEDPSLVWLTLEQGGYRAARPPAVGERTVWYTGDPFLARVRQVVERVRDFTRERAWFAGWPPLVCGVCVDVAQNYGTAIPGMQVLDA